MDEATTEVTLLTSEVNASNGLLEYVGGSGCAVRKQKDKRLADSISGKSLAGNIRKEHICAELNAFLRVSASFYVD